MQRLVSLSKIHSPKAILALAVACTMTGSARCAEPAPEPTPSPTIRDRTRVVERIDALLERRWRAEGVEPAPLASDSEFLRRAYLDLTGVIPRVSDVRDFLSDDRTGKRDRLVDRLLASPRYATHMATTWRNRLIPFGAEAPPAAQVLGLQNWLRQQFAVNRRYNGIVGDLLVTTTGDALGPALFFQTYNLVPEKLAATTAELFLGMRLQCAQCHDHPYDDWTQEEFWGFAAFFARVQRPGRSRPGSMYRLTDANRGEVKLPGTDEIVPPKYLGGRRADEDDGGTRRQQLAIWIVSRDNPYVARAAVNWSWAHLFGRGLVEPVGDGGNHNAPSHPQLLDELTDDFIASGFDMKELWRTLTRTRAYRLSSRPSESDLPAPDLFCTMQIKALTPEQLYDSVMRAAPSQSRAAGIVNITTTPVVAGSVMDPQRAEFVRRMRSPSVSPTEFSSGILQALTVMNGGVMAGATSSGASDSLGALDAPFMSEGDQIDALYLATLSRMPSEDERQANIDYLRDNVLGTDGNLGADGDLGADEGLGTDRRSALGDILWALLNSTEFAFNH